ncbi:BnaA05g16100D [Brassica napus]|uniref:Elongator complex protein 2 n=2 Tax=Brassica TaxID=3705 RepID=A0A078GXK2_BRANA|nr:BnaA05g16100D [Brassica napus]VDC71253.1 unnamed protein product [Brassica rapa]
MKQRMSIGMNWLVLKFMVMTLIVWLWFKAQFASMAEIWRWEVGTWKAVGLTSQFSLSKEQRFSLEYCPLSLCLSLSSLINSDKTMARLVTNSWQKVEAQKRIIWACSWRPFGHQFATSSRDKTLKIWPFERKMLGSNRRRAGCIAFGIEGPPWEVGTWKQLQSHSLRVTQVLLWTLRMAQIKQIISMTRSAAAAATRRRAGAW